MMIHKILEREEGFRATPYRCSLGFPTVGIGQRIGGENDPLPKFVLPRAVAEAWVDSNIADIKPAIATQLDGLNEARQAILISMAYQMGVTGLLKFKKFLAAIEAQDWKAAAEEMMNSRWAEQTPDRASRHQMVIVTGSISGIY